MQQTEVRSPSIPTAAALAADARKLATFRASRPRCPGSPGSPTCRPTAVPSAPPAPPGWRPSRFIGPARRAAIGSSCAAASAAPGNRA